MIAPLANIRTVHTPPASEGNPASTLSHQQAVRRVLVDADTANEISDLYAIVRALLDPGFDVIGLTSVQWHHRLAPENTVELSQQLNEDILRLVGEEDVAHPMGAEMIMGKPWGGDEARDSEAARFMIDQAVRTPDGEKLTIICLGAATNLASALKMAPDIVPKIACFMLAGRFWPDRGVWDKNEFNIRMDLNATNYLFNEEGLDLHIMPVNVLDDFTFRRDEVMDRLGNRGGIWDYLADRWTTYSPESQRWIMWDLALIIALSRPELATSGRFMTPPENTPREVSVYTSIDVDGMLADWWEVVESAIRGGN